MNKVVKLETKYYKLELLLKWKYREQVDEMLLNGISPYKVSDWCKRNGFSISQAKLYEYREMMQKAISERITMEALLGIGKPKRNPIVLEALGIHESKQIVKSELEVLDAIIQRGFDVLQTDANVKLQDAMRAIELKNRITGGSHGNLTAYGLDQLRELEQEKFNTIVEVVKRYLPEEHWEELESEIATAEHKFYEEKAPELLEEYEKANGEIPSDQVSTNIDLSNKQEVSGDE